jgi:SOS-response transcriptional repressor LexA
MPKKNQDSSKKLESKNAPLLKALGQHCRKLRIQSGNSIDRLSKENESLSTSVIHRLETGSGAVTVSALFKFAQSLDLHPKQLLDFDFPREVEIKTTRKSIKFIAAEDSPIIQGAKKQLLPVYSLQASVNYFGLDIPANPEAWLEVNEFEVPDSRLFIVKAVGDSMLPQIKDGELLVFRAHPAEMRQGKIVLVQYRGPADPDTGGSYAIREYHSAKTISSNGTWK